MAWINYQHLYYFWHIVNAGSITQASKNLRLAQPTISAQIISFEDVLGEKLFQRESKSVQLTEIGKVTFQYADDIFTLGNELLQVIGGQYVTSSMVKIGISDVVPKTLVYKILKPLMKNKEVQVSCTEDNTERLLADLSIQKLDLVIADRPIPPTVRVKAFNHFIGESEVVFLGSKKLADIHKKGFPASLSNAQLLLPTKQALVRQELDQFFSKLEVNLNFVSEFQDRALMKIAAKDGMGILPVPKVIATEVKREYRLEQIGTLPLVKESLYLITLERKIKNKHISELCQNAESNIYN